MARRITKPASRRSDDWRLPHFKIFPDELPGAVFVGRGRPNDDDLECARYLQRVRADYEQDGHAPTLIQELTQFGFPDSEIARAVLNPASITNCLYNFPIKDWGSPESRFAAEVADSLVAN